MQGEEHLEESVDAAVADAGAEEAEGQVDMQEQGVDQVENSLEGELEATRLRAEENWNTVLRLKAEQENLIKRSARDVENAHKFALDKFVNDLLPVKDSLELGLASAGDSEEVKSLREGTELTLKMFADVMEKFGVEEVDPTGEVFDPEKHQAMTMQENAEFEANMVISVMQKGYLLNGRLIRPAMVVVAK